MDAELQPDGANAVRIRAALLCLLREERAVRGLRPLTLHPLLAKAAKRYATDMARREYFSHVSPEGDDVRDRARAVRYPPRRGTWRVAEIIGWGAEAQGSAAANLARWMRSSRHRAKLLKPGFKHIGLGVVDGAPDGGVGVTISLMVGRR